jgi:phosphonatase-like hydrolase
MTIELVVFDMAGTTVDDGDAVGRCFSETLAQVGLSVDAAAINAVMGLPKPEAVRLLIEGSARRDELLDRADAIHADFVSRMTRHYKQDPSVAEVPGSRLVFETLHAAGIKVALNSGFGRETAQVIIDRLGWAEDGLIDASVTSDEVSRGRPHPDMIRRLMAMLGIQDSRRVAKVGDTPVDLEEGTNAGCGRVIGVTRGTHTREQLARLPHTDLIASVADLPGLFGLALGSPSPRPPA